MVSAALLSAAAWAVMLLFWHDFWRADQRLAPGATQRNGPWPEVVAVIPARNEAASIEAVLRAHAESAYPGRFSVVLVDDGSTDATRALAEAVAAQAVQGRGHPIHVIAGDALPAGWSGKLWAVSQGVAAAERLAPEAAWILLTDADIVHAPQTLGRLVAMAEERSAVLVSLMARLGSDSPVGWVLVPAYVFFFQKLYPFAAVNRRSSRIAGAAGGCMLVERARLTEIGGIAAICGALIDDCTLAARLKGTEAPAADRRPVWLGLAADEVVSLRDTARLDTIWETVARTAFVQLGRSWWLLALCTAGMAFLYLSGPVVAVTGLWLADGPLFVAGFLPWALQTRAFLPTVRLYGGNAVTAAMLPLAALTYMVMTLDSARRHLVGKGAPWKGRTYSELG